MALFLKKHYYRTRGVSLDLIHEIKPHIARAKKSKKYAWLREYDSMALQESVRNLNKRYRAFFEKRAGFPHYRSRRGPQSSYPAPTSPLPPTTCACRKWSRSRLESIVNALIRFTGKKCLNLPQQPPAKLRFRLPTSSSSSLIPTPAGVRSGSCSQTSSGPMFGQKPTCRNSSMTWTNSVQILTARPGPGIPLTIPWVPACMRRNTFRLHLPAQMRDER